MASTLETLMRALADRIGAEVRRGPGDVPRVVVSEPVQAPERTGNA